MATSLPYKAEYAKTGRGSCKQCKKSIAKGALKLAFMVQSRFHDGKDAHWFDIKCFFQKHRPASVGDIEDFEALRYDDQTKIKDKLSEPSTASGGGAKGKGKKGAAATDTSGFIAANYTVEYSKNARAGCKGCGEKIVKDEIRIAKKDYTSESAIRFGKGKGLDRWHHADCFVKIREDLEFFVAANGTNLPGFKKLKKEDQAELEKKLPAIPQKRKADDNGEAQGPAKKAKPDPNEAVIRRQNKLLFDNRDELDNELKKPALLSILSTNFQTIPEKESNPKAILDLVADIMTFGSMKKCTDCNGGQFLYKSGVGYQCTGYISEFTKCAFVPDGDVERIPFIVPDSLKQHSLFAGKSFQVTKRIIPKHAARVQKSDAGMDQPQSTGPKINKTPLKGFTFVVFGITPKKEMTKITEKLVEFGGAVGNKCHGTVAAAITSEATFKKTGKEVKEAKSCGIPILSRDFVSGITDVKYNLADEMTKYLLSDWVKDVRTHLKNLNAEYEKEGKKSAFENTPGSVRLKMKDGAIIDPQSGMDSGPYHVYKQNNVIYNFILNSTSVEDGSNSFYKMQLIESDNAPNTYHIFRAYGRIGTTIGGAKTDPQSGLIEARNLFTSKFHELTGNKWGDKFVKKAGKYTMLDVDYEQKDDIQKLVPSSVTSRLPIPVQQLISLIFDVDMMKQTLLEFEIDTEKMPLGKISRKQLLEAYSVLNDSFKLREREKDERKLKRLMTDVSNRFYTLIPHSFGTRAPPLLDNDELVKQKIAMLDNLMEMEIAYELLSRDKDKDDSPIDAHYKALKTELEVLERNSEEFQVIEKYLSNTHAPTHSNYALKIDQAFKVNREGERERFGPFQKFHNRKLLWHGSRITNFAGILSQGLRIAPPEAPVTGYMFGKGVYFADMVSKSANYCWTSRTNPTGILLLCEVALGDIHELKYANSSITKAPNNCHCVKGLGKTEPDMNELYVKDGVVVPYGKPAKSRTTDSSLLYNEYIIYDVSQVNIKYLLKCNFNYH